jgi:membrane-bound metal-dependent hydrolase YbcI (DUF457 family)
MPTPVGHALGGLAVAWFSASITRERPSNAFVVTCAIAAMAPDLDILVNSHRTYAHSIGAAAIVGAVAWFVRRRKCPPASTSPAFAALTIAAAYASHIVLDLLAKDTAAPLGLMALWPFSSRFYISGADLFMEVSRRYWKFDEFIVGNFTAVGWELILLAPVAALAWWLQGHGRKSIGNSR